MFCANCRRTEEWNKCVKKVWPEYYKIHGPNRCTLHDELKDYRNKEMYEKIDKVMGYIVHTTLWVLIFSPFVLAAYTLT